MVMFDENIIRFETAFDTPIRLSLVGIEMNQWLESAQVVLEDYQEYLKVNNLEFCRKTWTEYKKNADWSKLSELVLKKCEPKTKIQTFLGNLRKSVLSQRSKRKTSF